MSNTIKTVNSSGLLFGPSPTITESFTETLLKEQAERRNSLTARCKNPAAKAEAWKRMAAKSISNPDFLFMSSDELREAMDEELKSILEESQT